LTSREGGVQTINQPTGGQSERASFFNHFVNAAFSNFHQGKLSTDKKAIYQDQQPSGEDHY
jgi:hypothetical protein